MIQEFSNIVFKILITVMMIAGFTFSQSFTNNYSSSSKIQIKNGNGWGGFQLKSISGNLFLWGDYRFQTDQLKNGFKEQQKSGNFSGEINLNTLSYLFHPNFLKIEFGLGYAPGTQNNNFLVAPDRTDTRTSEKVNLGLTFFESRPVSLNAFANYNHSFTNRELTSDVESEMFSTGAVLYPKNNLLPASISYRYDKWNQNELSTNRDFESQKHSLLGRIQKRFTTNLDEHELLGSYNDYYRRYENNNSINNRVSRISLRDRFFFNGDRRNTYQSLIWWQEQNGSQPYKRFQVDQSVYVIPIHSLSANGKYQYFKFNNPSVDSRQHDVSGELSYQFYKSLKPFIRYQFTDNKQSVYSEKINRAYFGFNYTKKIPTGSFRLNYTYRLQTEDRISDAKNIVVVNEEHFLRDDEIVLLDNPRVILSSIIVKDETQTIIYQENLDYILIEQGQFVEIRRVPGGQIADGSTILVDYESLFAGTYKFDAAGNNFHSGINVLNNLLDIYFAYNNFDFNNFEGYSSGTFKFYNQRLLGVKVNIFSFSAGIEYDDYNSNITPYRSLRYFLDFNDIFFEKLIFTINLAYRDYLLIQDNETQIYKDANGRVSYLITTGSKINFLAYTRFQNGRGIDLDLYSFRTEFETMIRNIVVKLGYENFYRDFSGEIVNYNNIYLRIGRYF